MKKCFHLKKTKHKKPKRKPEPKRFRFERETKRLPYGFSMEKVREPFMLGPTALTVPVVGPVSIDPIAEAEMAMRIASTLGRGRFPLVTVFKD